MLDRSPPQAPTAFFNSLAAWCRRPARRAGNGLFCGGYPSPPSDCPSVSVALSVIAEMSSFIDRNRKSRARQRARKRPDRAHMALARVARIRACLAAPNPGRPGAALARLRAGASRCGATARRRPWRSDIHRTPSAKRVKCLHNRGTARWQRQFAARSGTRGGIESGAEARQCRSKRRQVTTAWRLSGGL